MFGDQLLMYWKGIQLAYGSHCTIPGLKIHFLRDIRPNARAIRQHLDQGRDPKEIQMVDGARHSNKRGNRNGFFPFRRYPAHFVASALRLFWKFWL